MEINLSALELDNDDRATLGFARDEVIKNIQDMPDDQTLSSGNLIKSVEDRIIAQSLAKKDSGEARNAARDMLLAFGDAILLKYWIDNQSQASTACDGIALQELIFTKFINRDIKFPNLKEIQQNRVDEISAQFRRFWNETELIKEKINSFIEEAIKIIDPKNSFTFTPTQEKNDEEFPFDTGRTYVSDAVFSSLLGRKQAHEFFKREQQGSGQSDLPREVKLYLIDGTEMVLTLNNLSKPDVCSAGCYSFTEDLREAFPKFEARDQRAVHKIDKGLVEALEFLG